MGLDPHGHEPGVPSSCVRSPLHVCNCCASCQTECQSEAEPAAVPKSMLERVGWAIVRLAAAAEMAAAQGLGGVAVAVPCQTCGSLLRCIGKKEASWQCVVCGTKV